MGYTHYWYRKPKLPKDKFDAFVADVRVILDACKAKGILVQYEFDDAKPAELTDKCVRFNGVGNDGHETFVIDLDFGKSKPSSQEEGREFDFCKTAYKPYDLAVTACLVAAKHHFGDDIKVSSDGEEQDWGNAFELCKKLFGYGYGKFDEDKGLILNHEVAHRRLS